MRENKQKLEPKPWKKGAPKTEPH